MKRLFRSSKTLSEISVLSSKLDILLATLTRTELQNSLRFQDRKRLLRYGHKVYSQSDEDGMLQEILSRIGSKSNTFVEIGVQNGTESNTTCLLVQGWTGVWIEGSPKFANSIRKAFRVLLDTGRLVLKESFVTAENINEIVTDLGVDREIDVLSIDIDGNDFHVFKAMRVMNPRVVIIEYNAKFTPPIEWVMKYNPNHIWDHTDYFGASLKSMEKMFSAKGYALVGCSISGTNAFFVREDLLEDKFCAPYTAENHYEPARYWMIRGWTSGWPAQFGPYDNL